MVRSVRLNIHLFFYLFLFIFIYFPRNVYTSTLYGCALLNEGGGRRMSCPASYAASCARVTDHCPHGLASNSARSGPCRWVPTVVSTRGGQSNVLSLQEMNSRPEGNCGIRLPYVNCLYIRCTPSSSVSSVYSILHPWFPNKRCGCRIRHMCAADVGASDKKRKLLTSEKDGWQVVCSMSLKSKLCC